MKRYLFVVLVVVFAACGTLPPAGDYYLVPADSNFTPEYTYCDHGQCWSVQIVDDVFAPTQEVLPTEVPTTTPGECLITAKSNVNVRKSANTTAEILGVFKIDSQNKAWDKVGDWYRVWWFPTGEFGWTKAEFYTTLGDCSFPLP